MKSTTLLPVKTMIKETADHQVRQNGQIVLSILNTLEMAYVLITSTNLSAIMIVGTVVIRISLETDFVMILTILNLANSLMEMTVVHLK